MQLEFLRQIFEEHSNIKLHENPSVGSRVVPCVGTDGRKYRNLTKLIVALHNYANAPKVFPFLFQSLLLDLTTTGRKVLWTAAWCAAVAPRRCVLVVSVVELTHLSAARNA